MPVYNGATHLVEAIDSILSQTFTNFELIIIDDGSTDHSLSVLKVYEKRDTRIKLISRENRNLATTLNEIIDLAQGKWIARMDQDDIALPDRFARQLAWLEQTDADICGGWVQFFGTSDKRILKHPVSDDAIKMALFFGSVFAHPTVMMKTNLVKKLRYDKCWEKCEDYDLWERAARANWRMTNIPEVLLMYRQHDAQISTATLSVQQELTQKIRRRHWLTSQSAKKIKSEWIDELLKLREPKPQSVNLNFVNLALGALLQRSNGEAHSTVLDHAMRLYLRAAASSSHVVQSWCRLNANCGARIKFWAILKLSMLSLFRLGPGNFLFERIKRVIVGRSRVFNQL